MITRASTAPIVVSAEDKSLRPARSHLGHGPPTFSQVLRQSWTGSQHTRPAGTSCRIGSANPTNPTNFQGKACGSFGRTLSSVSPFATPRTRKPLAAIPEAASKMGPVSDCGMRHNLTMASGAPLVASTYRSSLAGSHTLETASSLGDNGYSRTSLHSG